MGRLRSLPSLHSPQEVEAGIQIQAIWIFSSCRKHWAVLYFLPRIVQKKNYLDFSRKVDCGGVSNGNNRLIERAL